MTEKNNNSENWFRAIFENTVDCILIADVETRKFLDANNAACQIFGYSVEEFKNLEVDDIHPVEILSQVHEIFKKHLKGESYTDEDDILCKRKNGQVFYSNIKASLFDQNEKKCVIVFFRDNTEQNKINEQIRLQALVLDQISDNVTITDLDGNITYINKAQSDSMEYIKGDLVGKNVEIFGDDPERGATQKEILQKTLSDGF
ncbi:PAS domain S-box protein, partial [bacterium]|nr:PAS domain S-box protein [bacterium]